MNRMWLVMGVAVVSVVAVVCGRVRMGNENQDGAGVHIGGGSHGKEARLAAAESAEGSGAGWLETIERTAGRVFLGAEKGVVLWGYDVLAEPNVLVALTVKLQRTRLTDIEGARIIYTLADEVLESVKTDEEGEATLAWQPPGVGDYEIKARVFAAPREWDQEDKEALTQVSPVEVFVRVREPNAVFVVVDLDHTLVDSSFWKVLLGGGSPMANSKAVMKRVAERYSVIYLTHRPDLMMHTSKNWLEQHGYPPGPLLVSDVEETVRGSRWFKSRKLEHVRKTFVNVRIGIGDKIGDAQAYADNGMEAYLIPHYDPEDEEVRIGR